LEKSLIHHPKSQTPCLLTPFSLILLPRLCLLSPFYNISSGEELSIKDLAYLIKNIVGFNGVIRFDSSKPDGTMVKLTDPAKLNELGWKYNVDLEDGIRTMYGWYLNN
jgi:GDP-L-fucose synthase